MIWWKIVLKLFLFVYNFICKCVNILYKIGNLTQKSHPKYSLFLGNIYTIKQFVTPIHWIYSKNTSSKSTKQCEISLNYVYSVLSDNMNKYHSDNQLQYHISNNFNIYHSDNPLRYHISNNIHKLTADNMIRCILPITSFQCKAITSVVYFYIYRCVICIK